MSSHPTRIQLDYMRYMLAHYAELTPDKQATVAWTQADIDAYEARLNAASAKRHEKYIKNRDRICAASNAYYWKNRNRVLAHLKECNTLKAQRKKAQAAQAPQAPPAPSN